MSMLSDFAASAASKAFPIIGQEDVTINGTAFKCVLNEAMDEEDFSEAGFEKMRNLTAVCKTSVLPAGVILKKKATARGIDYRIKSISKGVSFTTITLETETKA